MTTKTLTLLLLCSTTLAQAVPRETLPEPRSDFPCPDAADITPCICTQVDLDLNLDCSNVESDEQLQNVFKAPFPFPDFTRLTIMTSTGMPRINIVNLTENVFQNVTFANIHISHTNLELIHPTVFDKSAPHLETITITDNFLALFPFDVVGNSPLLTDLRLFRNKLVHMPEMSSTTLTYLDISYNPGLQFTDYALVALPNLDTFVANDIELSHLRGNIFFRNAKLKSVDLSNNNIDTLFEGSLNFTSQIEEIRLHHNYINTVEAGAISGLGRGIRTYLYMHYNLMTDLAQSVWEPVFNSVIGISRTFVFDGLGKGTKIDLYMQHNLMTDLGQSVWEPVFDSVIGINRSFVFDDNPLECSCNILWLVSNPDHRETIRRGTICANTNTDILDVDLDFLLANC